MLLFSAQLLYGYGYSGPFAAEYEHPRQACGTQNFYQVLDRYAFLDEPVEDEREVPIRMFQIQEQYSAFRRSLFCLFTKYNVNPDVRPLFDLLLLHKKLQQDRLKFWPAERVKYKNYIKHVAKIAQQ